MGQQIRRLLVATDLSPVTDPLLGVASDLARRLGADLTVLHVVRPGDYAEMRQEVSIGLDEYVEHLQVQLQITFERAGGIASSARFEVVQGETVPDQILTAAARCGAELIIMGTHGRTGLRRAILGSVAEDVLRRAATPVLAVPLAALEARRALGQTSRVIP